MSKYFPGNSGIIFPEVKTRSAKLPHPSSPKLDDLSGYINLLKEETGTKHWIIKKVEILSQYFDPTSTYEKQPFEKGNNIYSNEMPIVKHASIYLKNSFLILLKY
ncbi:hypothetical protein FHW88_003232 [Mucilaginibacter sp. SG538B]|uniref:hypothetical protein n=1 Tax=unclassified Mucilaginibacter TaxID=2617802 RepID=UPI000B83BAF1|nr:MULTISPECIES: hypothetical protein [unclassified Mucilaginibacter]NVM64943.1 hypothetical protein [Mucilaginibacter sp. SG538B]